MWTLGLATMVTPLDATPTKTRATVLVVDDEFLIRWSLREQLVAEGFGVVEAESATAARAALEGHAVDAIVLDVRLPDADGLVLLRELLARHPLPIVLITAHGEADLAAEALAAGARAFMRKPFDVNELVGVVASLTASEDVRGSDAGPVAAARGAGRSGR